MGRISRMGKISRPTQLKMNKLTALAAATMLVGLCSCSTLRFYSQAARGQMEMLRKAKPVEQVMTDPKSKPLLKQKLSTVDDILDFAEKVLHLPAKGQYRRYANLGRRHAVWVVFAAPEFSVEPKTWSYPLLGKLAYRGFFQETLANAEADKLRAEGFDVYVAGVDAYSTLGFFRDPLLNTFIGRSDADLAELIFHELTHQRLYLSGDTDFNEAFATAVGQEGARRWLRARGRMKELAQYEKEMRVEREFIKLVLETREELERIYAPPIVRGHRAGDGRGPRAIRGDSIDSLFDEPTHTSERKYQGVVPGRPGLLEKKNQAFSRLKLRALALDARHGGSLKIERWFKKSVNNARLATVSSYYEMLPGFEALLKQRDGDLEPFMADIGAMRRLKHDERRQRIMQAIPQR
jgi:predicted aminopeptidase